MKYICWWLLIVLSMSCTTDSGTIKVKGSDTEVNLAVQLAEAFHDVHPDGFVSISGGGSGLGIAALLNGTADIANSSRRISADEVSLFKTRGITIDSFVFAHDAIAFVVSDKLALDSVSTADLAQLLNGHYRDWSSLHAGAGPLTIYGRQSNSGTHDYIRQKLRIRFSPHAKQMNGNAQILEAIKADPSGIGYVGAGYVMHGGTQGIKVLLIYAEKKGRAVSPLDAQRVVAGQYFFRRPLYQYYKASTYAKVKAFLDFEKSNAGRRIIQEAGYYPIH